MDPHGQQTTTSDTPIEEVLSALKNAIWSRRPILGEIMNKHGNQNLFEYSKDFMDVNKAPSLDPFKHELVDVIVDIITQRLNKEVGDRLRRQLDEYALVSTADHHAIIDHPFWVNANIISMLPFLDNPQESVFSLLVLSFASVSLNNASGFPRGILFHGTNGHSGSLYRLPILPDKYKMSIVYSCPAFTREDFEKTKAEVTRKEQQHEIDAARRDGIQKILTEYIGTDDVLSAPDLSTQITKINYRLWPTFFHASSENGRLHDSRMLDLLYLDIETVVTELLLRRHLKANTLLHRVLFDEKQRPLTLKYFNNIPGGFSLENGWGTYMFWGIDKHLHRVKMTLEGNRLVSQTHPYLSIDFTPEAIAEALRNKTIYPSMLLCYLMVSLYYGMKCLGGFCQVHDLTVTKYAWRDLLLEIGEEKEAAAVEPIQTKELGGDGMVLAYSRTSKGELFPATGIDMALTDTDTSVAKYLERSKHVTLSEMMAPMLPEMYTVLYPSYERDSAMLTVSPEEIIQATGLGEKLTQQLHS